MSRNQRIGLVIAAVVLAVVAFVALSPGDDESGQTAQTTTQATEAETATEAEPEATEAEPPPPPEPEVTRIRIRGGEVAGGPAEIRAKKGDTVVFVVSSDAPDDIHLHGYDVERQVAPGQPARFRVRATLEGQFEIESHVAEDAGRDPLVATLVVEPQ
jgi:plastocyanin